MGAHKLAEREWFFDELVNFTVAKLDRLKRAQKARTGKRGVGKAHTGIKLVDFNEALKQSRPILIGPATLDSLLNKEPESYDYVRDEKLPFEYTLFEFADPIKIDPLGASSLPDTARGILFTTAQNLVGSARADGSVKYTAILYFDDLEDYGFYDVTIGFDPENKTEFVGQLSNLGEFHLDTEAQTIKLRMYRMGEHEERVIAMPWERFEGKETIRQMTNLCVNLINYINAHNTTIIKRKRDVEVKKKKGGRVSAHIVKKPYYLVRIDDRFVEVDEDAEPSGSWTLTERVYVRGHDRRYRDGDGRIKRTIWIHPYVRGPPGAPWRDTRYEVLAKKLLEEKKMMEEAGIKQ